MIKKILFLAALIISSIQSYSQVAITATTTDVTCYGGNDGVITVNVTAGTGPYRYTLYYEHASGDFRLGDHPGIAASSFTFQTGNGSLNEPGAEAFGIPKYGSYRVRVISSDPIAIPGNPKSLNVSVNEPTEVIYTTNIIADCGTGNGSVAFTVSDGTPGYTISWTAAPGALPPGGAIASSGGSFTESNLIFGEYIFDITDANSCVKTDTITVEAPPIDQPINESPAATICDGDTQDVTLANSELGVDYQVMLNGAPFDVPVSGDGGANQLLGTLTQADGLTVAGSPHVITVQASRSGCTITLSDNISVTVNPYPNATITPAGPYCEADAPVNLTAATPGGLWSGDGITDGVLGTFDPATAGVGTHTITYTVTVGGCTSIDTEDIVVDEALDPTIDPEGPFCETDAAINLAAADPGGTWSGAGITDGAAGTFNPATAGPGTHTITYTLVNGACTTVDTEDIVVDAALDPTITPAGPYCETDVAVNLVAATGGGLWTGDGITDGAAGTFDPATAGVGTHTITYTIINGACTTVDTEDIVVDEALDPTITAAGPYCETDAAVNLTAANPGGTWSGTGITDGAAGTFNPATAGIGTHTITYTLVNGACTTVDTEDIVVDAALDPTINPPAPFCETDAPVNLTAATGGGTWTGTGITDGLLGTFDPVTAGVGTHTITYTIINGACTTVDTEDIVVDAALDPTITAAGPFCESDAAVNLIAATGGGTWTGTGITDGIAGTFDPATAGVGTHTITYTIVNGACTTVDTEDINVKPLPIDVTITLSGPRTVCEGTSVLVTLDDSESGTNYQVMFNGVPFGPSHPGVGSTNHILENIPGSSITAAGSPHLITVEATRNGCVLTLTDNIEVTVDTATDPTIDPAGPYCETDAAANLTAANPGGTWSGTGITDGVAGIFDPATAGAGTHTVTYTLVNGACTTSDTEDIVVDAALDPTITATGPFCETDASVNLTAATGGGTWSGTGITDGAVGTFDPVTAGIGTHTITYTVVNGACTTVDTEDIIVDAALDATITVAGPFCESDVAVNLIAANPGGTWSGTGITDGAAGTFDPGTAGVGTHTITYTLVNGACTTIDTEDIIVDAALDPTITPAGPYCETDAAVNLSAATAGGTWSGTGITDGALGTFDPVISGHGTHTITYTVVNGGCTTVDTEDIIVDAEQDATITAAGPFCEFDAPVTIVGATAG
ncbi:MAG: SprB repeat-containing protein, partial [Bacteroidota bacterium]